MNTDKQEIIVDSQNSIHLMSPKIPDYDKEVEELLERTGVRDRIKNMPPGFLRAHPDPFDIAIDIDAA